MRLLVCVVGLFLAQPVFAQVSTATPADGSTHYLNTTIQVRVDCQNASRVQKVDLFVDGVLAGSSTAAPYQWSLDTGNVSQWRTLRAVADYGSGGTAEDLIQIQVTGVTPALPAATVTYVGVDHDVTDFQSGVDYGNSGYWFPMFDASSPRSGRPTEDRARNSLPIWAGPMTHMMIYEL
ncbi:Ig-like domain-containing protein, partial [Planctomycetota bacterium]|nr:Ig-like domain-containing protein [Planctomycetota bacterium]